MVAKGEANRYQHITSTRSLYQPACDIHYTNIGIYSTIPAIIFTL